MTVETALVALGSNLGDRRWMIAHALAELDRVPGVAVMGVSRLHETAPIGGPPGQGAFLNAVARIETSLEPVALHERLGEIERAAGRVRLVRWGERTLDLDLILFGTRTIDTPGLTVPHPRFAVRRFVLEPLVEVAPEAVDPRTGLSAATMLARLDRRRVYYVGWDEFDRDRLAAALPLGWTRSEEAGDAAFAAIAARSLRASPAGVSFLGVPEDVEEAAAELRAACEAASCGVD